MKETASLLSLLLILTGCASFGVFKTQPEKDLVCAISDTTLAELTSLANAWGVDLSVLVKAWNDACSGAVVSSHANYSQKALHDLAMKHVREVAMESSKGNEKANLCTGARHNCL